MFANMGRFKDVKLWKTFMDAGADINKPNKLREPPLLSVKNSSKFDKPENGTLLRLLVEEGLDLGAKDATSESVLFSLLDQYDLKLASVEMLLDLGCSVKARGNKGETILHKCVRKNVPFEIFLHLIDAGADPTMVDDDGNTIFHALASVGGSINFIRKMKDLISLGVPTDSENKSGRTPLILGCAIASKHYETDNSMELLDCFLNGKLCLASDVFAVDSLGASPLHYAASFSQLRVQLLLRAGASPTARTPENLTPLHIAARGRASNVVGLLLHHLQQVAGQGMIDAIDNNGCTALHYACRSGRPESVRYLLSAGANVFARDLSGRSPLHALAEFPEEDVLWIPTQQGDLPDEFDAACITLGDLRRPYGAQAPRYRGPDPARTRDILEMLESAGADLEAVWMVNGEAQTPMDVAVRTGCAELVNEFRRRGITAMDSAAEDLIPQPEGAEEAKLLLARVDPPTNGRWDTSEYSKSSMRRHGPKFEEILKRRDYNLFHEFVRSGGDLFAHGGGTTGLFSLVKWGYANLLEIYSAEAAKMDDLEWPPQESQPTTLLALACSQTLPRMDVIKVLVETVKVDVDRAFGIPMYRKSPLHLLASGGHFWAIEAIEYLLDHGANIEVAQVGGETPLTVAVANSHYGIWKEETMRVLLSRGANPNAIRNDGQSCLSLASTVAAAKLLLKYGANISVGSINPLMSAITGRNLEMAKLLLDAGADPNCKEIPLYQAARPNDQMQDHSSTWLQAQKDMIVLLLERGSNPFALIDDESQVHVTKTHGGRNANRKEEDKKETDISTR